MAVRHSWWILAAVVLVIAALAWPAAAGRSSVCSCLCCNFRGESCTQHNFTTTFCSFDQCSESICTEKFLTCHAVAGTVQSACTSQESWVNKALVVLVAFTIVVLFILSLLRYRVPFLMRIFPKPVNHHTSAVGTRLQKTMHRNQELFATMDPARM